MCLLTKQYCGHPNLKYPRERERKKTDDESAGDDDLFDEINWSSNKNVEELNFGNKRIKILVSTPNERSS